MRACCIRGWSVHRFVGLLGGQTLEVTASDEVDVPSRLPQLAATDSTIEIPAAELSDYRRQMRQNLRRHSCQRNIAG